MLAEDVMYTIDSDTKPYWEATKNRELLIQHCPNCGQYQFYPRVICTHCMSDVEWVKAKGTGKVYSHSVVYRTFISELQDKVPFILALVNLDEGPRMMTNLVDVDPGRVKIGMPVKADFRQELGEYRLVYFKPFE